MSRKFSLLWSLVGYESGATGYYKEIIIENKEYDIAPFTIISYESSSTVGHAVCDNDYWTGIKINGSSTSITLKKDCLYRSSSSSYWVKLKAGTTISHTTAYTNNIGACMIFE